MKTLRYFYPILILLLIYPNLNAQYHNANYTHPKHNTPFYNQYPSTQTITNHPNLTTIQSQPPTSSLNYYPNTPFHDPTETPKLSRIQRDETPTDPSVPIPAHHIPLILCCILWTIIKYIKNKEKKTKFIS
jgi:hypothetical protein